MSISNAVQSALYELLKADAGVAALVGARVYDRPDKAATYPYIRIGPGDASRAMSDPCVQSRVYALQIDCFSAARAGVYEAWTINDAVCEALHLATPVLAAGALIEMRVVQMRTLPDRDPAISHGVVVVEIEVEETDG
jgi:hypothetical protein